jgi:hypothetical protein
LNPPLSIGWGENATTEDNNETTDDNTTEQTINSDGETQHVNDPTSKETDPEQDTQENTNTIPNTQHTLTLNAEPKPMEPADDQTLLKQTQKIEESDSGTEDKEYKEGPFYYDQTPDAKTNQAQPKHDNERQESSSSDPNLTSEKAQYCDATPSPTIKVGQKLKRGGRYATQNDALQRLFRPSKPTDSTAQDEREEQESSSIDSEWGRTRQKTLKEHEEEWQAWNEVNQHDSTTAYLPSRTLPSLL